MREFPPLSLSTYWSRVRPGVGKCLVDIPTPSPQGGRAVSPTPDTPAGSGEEGCHDGSNCKSNGKKEKKKKKAEAIPLLALPELDYLSANGCDSEGPKVDEADSTHESVGVGGSSCATSSGMAANLRDHDPLGVVQKLFDVTECLALAIPPSDRHVLLSVGLALGVKSGRASLLLVAASVLASSESVLNDIDIDIKILRDVKAFVVDLKKKEKERGKLKTVSAVEERLLNVSDSSGMQPSNGGTSVQVHGSDNEAYFLLKEGILR